MLKPAIITEKKTFDGKAVQIWDDGSVTHGQLQVYILGNSRSESGRALNVQAGILLAGEVALYDLSEMRKAVSVCRKAVRQGGKDRLDYFRSAMNPAVKSAKPHGQKCSCPKCLVAHVRNGCRIPACTVCG